MSTRVTVDVQPLTALEWMGSGACTTADPELFHPISSSHSRYHNGAYEAQVQAAKAVCAGCHVRRECLAYAYDTGDDWAVLGGYTAQERRQRPELRTQLTPLPPPSRVDPFNEQVTSLVRRGMNDMAISRATGRSQWAVRETRIRLHLPAARPCRLWSADDAATVRRLAAAGATDPEIGRVLGRSADSIYQRRRADGIPGRRKKEAAT